MTEQEQIEEIKNSRGWYLTKEIENPCPKLQMIAIKTNFKIIRGMQNPCEEVLTYVNNLSEKETKALLSWSSNIQFIKNQSKELQIFAIKSGEPHDVINYIEKPCKKVLKYIKKYDSININEESQLKAVLKNGLNLMYVRHFELYQQGEEFKINEDVELAAIKQNINAIKYCNIYNMGKGTLEYINSSEYLQIKAVKKEEYFIGQIDKPSKKVQIAAVKNAYAPDMIVFDFINEEDLCKKLKKQYY